MDAQLRAFIAQVLPHGSPAALMPQLMGLPLPEGADYGPLRVLKAKVLGSSGYIPTPRELLQAFQTTLTALEARKPSPEGATLLAQVEH